jgi:hypothetical protein
MYNSDGTINPSKNEEILFVGFNQDQGCIAVGTQKGFRICNSFPFKNVFQRGKIIILNNLIFS